MTFDDTLKAIEAVFNDRQFDYMKLQWLIIYQGLPGEIKLCVSKNDREEFYEELQDLYKEIAEKIKPYACEPGKGIAYLEEKELITQASDTYCYGLHDFGNIWVARSHNSLVNLSYIEKAKKEGAPRVIFIGGDEGRDDAFQELPSILEQEAYKLVKKGKKVLALEFDFYAPTLDEAFDQEERVDEMGVERDLNDYGLVDWLIEDRFDNGDAVIDSMAVKIHLEEEFTQNNGSIHVVPAFSIHNSMNEFAKLEQAFISKMDENGMEETWIQRFERLLARLEEKYQPDVIFFQAGYSSREACMACVANMGARLIFACQTNKKSWSQFFQMRDHWNQVGGYLRGDKNKDRWINFQLHEIPSKYYEKLFEKKFLEIGL